MGAALSNRHTVVRSSRYPMNRPMYSKPRSGSLLIGAGSLILVVGGVMLATYFAQVQDATAGSSGLTAVAPAAVEPKPVEPKPAQPKAAAQAEAAPPATGTLAEKVALTFDGHTFESTWGELGVVTGEGGQL